MIKKIQKVVRTNDEDRPVFLEEALENGWTVAHVNQLGKYQLEYIMEKEVIVAPVLPKNLGNSKAVKNPEN